MCTITAAAMFALPRSLTLDTQQNGWNPLKIIWELRLFGLRFNFPAY